MGLLFRLLPPRTNDPEGLLKGACSVCRWVGSPEWFERHASTVHNTDSYSVDSSMATRFDPYQPRKYRKKPVIIEAMPYDPINDEEGAKAVLRWLERYGCSFRINYTDGQLYIVTLEGEMLVSNGDYVIRGVKGEFYPHKADIFPTSYEEVV